LLLLPSTLAVASAFAVLLLQSATLHGGLPEDATPPRGCATQTVETVEHLRGQLQKLRFVLNQAAGDGIYLTVDTTHNRLQIRRGDRVVREAVCATGSGKVLLGDKNQVWEFGTPVRAFRVERKVTRPIWKKPEWAFVEVGRKAPVLPWEFDRLDTETLGPYALELGDGFEIHGTLYPNLLGRHITHGCVRLDDEDLEAVFTMTEPGTRVLIY
jgi:L,D-transpeptidase YbiS